MTEQQPRGIITQTGEGTSGWRVYITLQYDRTEAQIELGAKELQPGQQPGIDLYRRALHRLGEAAQLAAVSPGCLSWPGHLDER